MPSCANCGSHVTPTFVRVYGTEGVVRSCTNCTTLHFDRAKDGSEFDGWSPTKRYVASLPESERAKNKRPFLRYVEEQTNREEATDGGTDE